MESTGRDREILLLFTKRQLHIEVLAREMENQLRVFCSMLKLHIVRLGAIQDIPSILIDRNAVYTTPTGMAITGTLKRATGFAITVHRY
jgi:hypothetical protein